ETAHLQEWIDERRKLVRHETVFREMTDICSCLSRAPEIFSSLKNYTPPRRPRMKTPTRRRERLISTDEARVILTHLRRPREDGETERYALVRRDAADLLQIGLLTSARRMEILNLRWSDVNFEWGNLRVTDEKTSKVKNIPLSRSLAALLRERQRHAGKSPLVFWCLEGSTMLRSSTDQIYRRACEQLKVPYGRDTPGGWVLHDTRHTAITAMLHAGHSLESVMAISGHSARVMAMRYAHSTEATRRAAVSALDQFGGEKISAAFSAGEGSELTLVSQMTAIAERRDSAKRTGKAEKAVRMRAARGAG
ncbi:MAG: site-specific integrase, partial [Pyrinomonadaceae bacterium]